MCFVVAILLKVIKSMLCTKLNFVQFTQESYHDVIHLRTIVLSAHRER